VAMLGVNASADATNRLSVAGAATLFNNAGAGHQLKINKNATANTASLLYQTGGSGCAEIGTTGDDKLHVKMSADGSSWQDAVVVTADGKVGFGTSDPGGLGGDVVLSRSMNAPLITKVYNPNSGSSTVSGVAAPPRQLLRPVFSSRPRASARRFSTQASG
jgi:hypothetical protein